MTVLLGTLKTGNMDFFLLKVSTINISVKLCNFITDFKAHTSLSLGSITGSKKYATTVALMF